MYQPIRVKRLINNGYIADLRTARKPYRCSQCKGWINKGDEYYSIIMAGSGLGSLKFPERVHIECIEGMFEILKERDKCKVTLTESSSAG